jgi:H+-transporting ATPase
MAAAGTRKISPVDFGGELEPLTSKERIRKVLGQLDCDDKGLSKDESETRLAQYGRNELPSHEESLILKFFSYFWNPLSWTMEVAIILAVILAVRVDCHFLPFPTLF